MPDIKDQIIRELATACANLGAKSDLLGAACSYGDTLSDEDVLSMLKEWNAHGVVHPQDPHAELMLRRLLHYLLPGEPIPDGRQGALLGKTFQKAEHELWKKSRAIKPSDS